MTGRAFDVEEILKKTAFTVILLWILTTALAAWAQVDTATVTGTVRDSSGAVSRN